jgi:4-azaleucine resistance transporter AzlC
MRSILRTPPSIRDPLFRDVLALASAAAVVGVSYGAISVAAGVSPARTIAMSLFVFAGGAQFLAAGVVGAGGTAVAAVVGGLLLNARHVPFGLAIGDTVGRGPLARAVGSHVMTDESVAFSLARPDPATRRRAYVLAGAALFVTWNVATVIGVVAGGVMGDPDRYGVDAAFPAGMFALLLPALREGGAVRVALGGALLALLAAPFLPPGLPVLVALGALVLGISASKEEAG